MSDRTTFQCYVYDCPEDQRAAAVRVLMDEHVLDMEYADDEGDPLNLAKPYFAEEATLGTGRDVAPDLIAEVPGASFYLWEDPSNSGEGPLLGEMHAYTPELGAFTAECDQHGVPRFAGSQVKDMIRDITQGGAIVTWITLAAELDKAMGGPWIEHRKANAKQEDGN